MQTRFLLTIFLFLSQFVPAIAARPDIALQLYALPDALSFSYQTHGSKDRRSDGPDNNVVGTGRSLEMESIENAPASNDRDLRIEPCPRRTGIAIIAGQDSVCIIDIEPAASDKKQIPKPSVNIGTN